MWLFMSGPLSNNLSYGVVLVAAWGLRVSVCPGVCVCMQCVPVSLCVGRTILSESPYVWSPYVCRCVRAVGGSFVDWFCVSLCAVYCVSVVSCLSSHVSRRSSLVACRAQAPPARRAVPGLAGCMRAWRWVPKAGNALRRCVCVCVCHEFGTCCRALELIFQLIVFCRSIMWRALDTPSPQTPPSSSSYRPKVALN